jgi:hypothetical protein
LGGTETVNNVSVKVGNPQFTLIWDSNVDLDLHVLEPGGSHISFEYRNGRRGGELDVDDVDGFGPENIYWGGGLNKGNGPPGEYKWYVHYYGGAVSEFGRQVLKTPTRWRVRLKHNGTYKVFEGKLNAAGQQSKVYTFPIEKAEGSDDEGNVVAPARGGDSNAFNNPPSQVGVGRREVDTGSFNAPNERGGVNNRTRGERNSSKKADTKDAPPAVMPDTKKAPEGADSAPAPRVNSPARDGSNWVIVKPEGVGFEARMPDEPIEERRTGEAVDAPEILTWSLNRIEGGFTVAVTTIPVDRAKGDANSLLDAEARREVAEASGTNSTMSARTVDGHPVIDVEADLPDKVVAGGGKARFQLVLVGRRVYRISAIGTRDFLSHPDTRRFLDSFKVTGSPK